ncbi:MAG TPA: HPr family phosphocarrier protein, partial [Planctomycetes bacterium]|nr:HPr family phosphocarrier protein [Planctomycetota bacterium]
LTPEAFPESNFVPITSKQRLPRNVDEAELLEEEQRVAEVATKFLQAAEMVAGTGIRRIPDEKERHEFFTQVCTEELARVYEATVHNLQSTYDTHIRNTVLEGRDPRLPRLRGHISGALHLLQAVTYLAHFVERHEAAFRRSAGATSIGDLVERSEVERVAIHSFLLWAHRILQSGVGLAEELLPAYSNLQELALELPDGVALHARPAALIVGIVNHYGTPVELELGGRRCNAGSILELLVTVGSNPDERRFLFRGDSRPLGDIQLLFQSALGEKGLSALPRQLQYLREE